MGYNGSNRRPKGSIIRKSSLNFGTKLVSRMIAVPIAAVLEVPSAKNSRATKTIAVSNNLYNRELSENSISISSNIITSITSGRYMHLITDLEKLSQENQIVERIISSNEVKLRKLKFKKNLFILFPNARKKIKEEIFNTTNEIEILNSKKQKEILDVKELINVEKEQKISSLKTQLAISTLTISNDSISLFDTQRVCNSFILNRVKAQLLFESNLYVNHCPVLIITAQYIDLFFLGAGIVIKSKEMLAIVDYEDIRFEYTEVKIKENEHFDSNGYILDGYTFLYSRTDGGADLRYSYNPQIPIIKYGKMSLDISGGLAINIFFNHYDIGFQLYNAITI